MPPAGGTTGRVVGELVVHRFGARLDPDARHVRPRSPVSAAARDPTGRPGGGAGFQGGAGRRCPHRTESTITSTTLSPEAVPAVLPRDFEDIVQAHLDGRETDRDRAVLEHFRTDWVRVLHRLLDRADRVIEETRRTVRGPERAAII